MNKKLFQKYTPELRQHLLQLRKFIFEVAEGLDGIGPIEERLRWGQASYLTSSFKSGTTIRIDQYKNNPHQCAMYFHCQTTVVSRVRRMFGDRLNYEDNRAIIFEVNKQLPKKIVKQCIEIALTYHQ